MYYYIIVYFGNDLVERGYLNVRLHDGINFWRE